MSESEIISGQISTMLREHAHRQEILAYLWMGMTVLLLAALAFRFYRGGKPPF